MNTLIGCYHGVVNLTVNITKIGNNIYEIPVSDGMNVPGRIFSSDSLMEYLREDKSLEQVMNVARLPGIIGASMAMPDIHWGYGFPIGGVAAFDYEEGIVCPGGVGYDINCGVTLVSTGMTLNDIRDKKKALLDKIFTKVPAGMSKSRDIKLNDQEMNKVLQSGVKWAIEKGFATKEDQTHTEDLGSSIMADPEKVSNEAKSRGKSQLGTIGSGNHFLEIQTVEKIFESEISRNFGIMGENEILIMIHTGSRGLGHQIATDYIASINREESSENVTGDRQLNFVKTKSRTGESYIGAMFAAANFGYVNRAIIVHKIRESFKEVFSKDIDLEKIKTVYSLAHNIAKIEEHIVEGKKKKLIVHRKGATRAFAGEYLSGSIFSKYGHPVIIPGDMGTASYVLVGKKENMKLSFGSTCHGAGRKLSRKKSMESFKSEQVKEKLENEGIYLRAVSSSTIAEESPGSYKNINDVIMAVRDANLAIPVSRNVPVAVMKG